MKEIIERLKLEYDKYAASYSELDEQKKEIDNNIKFLAESLDRVSDFDEDDKETLCSMLDSEHQKKFKSIEKYFSILDKFPNQQRIKDAKKVLEEIKQNIIQQQCADNEKIISAHEKYKKNMSNLKTLIEKLSDYDKTIYLSTTELNNIISFVGKYDITDEVIEFFMEVLQNNNRLAIAEEVKKNKMFSETLSRFITRLQQINKSLNVDLFRNYDIVVKLLENMISYNYDFLLSDEDCELLANTLNNELESEYKIVVLKRIKFLIHLHNIKISYDENQISFLNQLLQHYNQGVNDKKDEYLVNRNKELIEKIESEYKFDDIENLKEVFELNEFSNIEKAKIILSIMDSNISKKELNTEKLSDSLEDILERYDLSFDILKEDSDLGLSEKELFKLLDEQKNRVNGILSELSYSNANFILDILSYCPKGTLVYILVYSSAHIIKNIKCISQENNIDINELLKNYPYILISYEKSNISFGEYDEFIKNIDFLKQKGIDINKVVDILNIKNKKLEGRYILLKNVYNIDISTCPEVLCNPLAISTLDFFIEENKLALDYLRNNPHRLSYNNDRQILYFGASSLLSKDSDGNCVLDQGLFDFIEETVIMDCGDNFDCQSSKELWDSRYDFYDEFFETVRTKGSFDHKIIPDEYYKINESIFSNNYIKFLENPKNKIKKNEYTYLIKDTLISRIKFLRVCSYLYDKLKEIGRELTIDAIIYSLRFDSFLCGINDERNVNNFYISTSKQKSKKKK